MRLWNEIKGLFGEAGRVMRERRLIIFASFAVIIGLVVLMLPHDQAWTTVIRDPHTERSLAIADFFSDWGDYPLGPLVVCAGLVVASFVLGRAQLRRLGLAVVIAASCAGIVAVTVRDLVGRPRPRSDKPDGIYGPSLEYELNSFPSGHSACAYATAFALMPSLPLVAIPALAFATGTAWSRVHSYHHHPTDVLVGGAIGALFGLSFGAAARRRNHR